MTLQPPTNSSIKTTQYASICSKKCEKNIDLKHKHQQKHGGSDFVIRDALFLVNRYFSVRVWKLGLWTLEEERRNRSDLIEVFKMFSGYTDIDIKVLFTLDSNDKGLRGHSKKICKVRFNIDVRKYFFFKSCY